MKNKEFYQGMSIIAGTVARHGYAGIAVDAMDSNGITLSDMIDAGSEEFDLKPLREEYKLQGRNLNGLPRKRA